MKLTLKELELAIPTIDLLESRKLSVDITKIKI